MYSIIPLTEYPPRGCSYLDARLSFRGANSTGFLEMGDEEGQWGRASTNDAENCQQDQRELGLTTNDDVISRDTVMVICRQLGFNSSVVQSFSISVISLSTIIGDTFTLISVGLSCSGNETNLTSCQHVQSDVPPNEDRKRRGIRVPVQPSVCNTLTEIQCGGE